MSVARRILLLALVVVAALIQVSILDRIEIGPANPDLVVLVVVSCALLVGSIGGTITGFVAGICLSLFAAVPLGPSAFLLAIVGYWTGRWGEVLVTDEHPVPPLLAGVCGTLIVQIGLPIVSFLVSPSIDVSRDIWLQALMTTAISAVLALPVYALVRRAMLLTAGERTSLEPAAEL